MWTTGDYQRTIAIEEVKSNINLGVEVTKNGCKSEKEISIEVIPPPLPEIFIPNAFTPNGDGLNDYFMAEGKNIDSFRMKIYNKWGEMIFESENIYQGWNGQYENRPCPQGTYIYTIQYTGFETVDKQSVVSKNGTLQLIK